MPNDTPAPAPYVSYGTFKSTIDQLADSTVPTGPFDRRVLDWLSGADYGALMSALRFLGLVDDDRRATADYRGLVQASKDAPKFKEALRAILDAKYKPVIGSVDLGHGTITELEKAFKDYGVSQGQMLTKSVRFFVKALTECGVALSPHITKPKPRPFRVATAKNGVGEKARIKTRQKVGPVSAAGSVEDLQSAPLGYERMPIPGVANAFIQYPTNLTPAHCEMFTATIGVLRAYAQSLGGGGKEKKP
jgi:hypothetical protein